MAVGEEEVKTLGVEISVVAVALVAKKTMTMR